MKTPATFIKACDVLRLRVRYQKGARLRLPSSQLLTADDTALIRTATRLYVETWIVPLIDAMQSGDITRIKEMLP